MPDPSSEARRRRQRPAADGAVQAGPDGIVRPADVYRNWDEITDVVLAAFVAEGRGAGGDYSAGIDDAVFYRIVDSCCGQNPQWGIPPADRSRLAAFLRQEFFGFGPLAPWMEIEGLEEIMCNTWDCVYFIVRGDKRRMDPSPFRSEKDVRDFLSRVFAAHGREINLSNPMEDATLPDGSRVHAEIPPLAVDGATFNIRKFNPQPFTMEQYLATDMFSEEFLEDLKRWIWLNANMVVAGGTSSGKAQPLTARVLTPAGFVEMGSLRVGDLVIGSDGGPTAVIGVFPQGPKEVFRVEFSDGASTECCDDHLWTVRTRKDKNLGRDWRVLPLSELRAAGLRQSGGGFRWFIPMLSPAAGDDAADDLPVEPYALGALLGDGGLTNATPIITTPDTEVVGWVERALPVPMMARQVTCRGARSLSFRLSDGRAGASNSLTRALEELGLMGLRSEDKHIPEAYLLASRPSRFALLQGLLDTDGGVEQSGRGLVFSTSSPRLADGVRRLVWSLGGTATLRSKIPNYVYLGERRTGLTAYQIAIRLPETLGSPFRVGRKARALATGRRDPTRSIVAVESMGVKECQCIAVSAADSLYVTDDYVLTHNTTWLNAIGQLLPPSDRVIVVENTKELRIRTDDTLYKQAIIKGTHENADDPGSVTIRDAIRGALRQSPDRLIVGEVRSREAIDLLDAMNTGHDGSWSTIHADSSIDVISRLEGLAMRDGTLPIESIQDMIGRAIDICVQVGRFPGSPYRKVLEAWQVLHPIQIELMRGETRETLMAIREAGDLRRVKERVVMFPLYQRDARGQLVKRHDFIVPPGKKTRMAP